jgi:hypothetical protein
MNSPKVADASRGFLREYRNENPAIALCKTCNSCNSRQIAFVLHVLHVLHDPKVHFLPHRQAGAQNRLAPSHSLNSSVSRGARILVVRH